MSADNYWTVIPTPDGGWQPRMGFESDEGFPEYRLGALEYETFAEALEAGMDAYERDPYGTEYGYQHHPSAPDDARASADSVVQPVADRSMEEPLVTRIEVVDDTGRAFVRYYETTGVGLHVQDQGRTLKVFARTPRRPLSGAPDYWCQTCNRGTEGCTHPIEEGVGG